MGKKIDMIGFKINKLTVLGISNNRTASGSIKWICQCECGNICEVDGCRLRSGMAKSCGCESIKGLEKGRGLYFKDLTNQTFGKLKVLKRIEDKIYADNAFVQYECECECGRHVNVIADNLRRGNTQSCGKCRNNSHGNNKIDKLLSEANIPFEREKRFDTCKDKMQLPFDFYVDNKYLIEYDGRQHFKDKNTLFYNPIIRTHDDIKTNWCLENNIPLIRIPYTKYDTLCLEDLLIETSQYLIK